MTRLQKALPLSLLYLESHRPAVSATAVQHRFTESRSKRLKISAVRLPFPSRAEMPSSFAVFNFSRYRAYNEWEQPPYT